MTRLRYSLALLSLFYGTLFWQLAAARNTSPEFFKAKRLEAMKRWEPSAQGRSGGNRRATDDTVTLPGVKNITFTNPKASQYYVDGTTLPFVDFNVGPSWSGLMPISAAPDEQRKLFFWFFPAGMTGSLDDLIFWTNGGPGCSSLEGSLEEHGPFTWQPGQALPTRNQWSWTNLSSVLYVEQPLGTGFTQGEPTEKDENDVARQVVGFLQQFLEVFSELKGKKFYLTGESYAGVYVPYIANYIYENTTRSSLDLDLLGIWINDPLLSSEVIQLQVPAVAFVHKYENVFAFNQTFLRHLDDVADKCNYLDYMEKYVRYPPKGQLPLPGKSVEFDEGCDVWDEIYDAALLLNPAFNVYRIFDTWPILWDVLGAPGSPSQQSPVYFNRPDVKAAIHAPSQVDWVECSGKVFPNGDASPPPAFTVLPNVIEKSKRFVIAHGLADFLLPADGSRIVIQNLTWNNQQGFQTPIETDSFIVDDVGALGQLHTERGLTYVEVRLSGHMLPGSSPRAAFQVMEYLLGFRPTP